jgi:hypothetical protein
MATSAPSIPLSTVAARPDNFPGTIRGHSVLVERICKLGAQPLLHVAVGVFELDWQDNLFKIPASSDRIGH